ncbi:MAG TPA: hypothetical protein VF219_20835 [Vicinamibacterales bacterium]
MVSPHPTIHRADQNRHPHLARLRAIVRSRMWKWLFDAHRLVGVSVEVLDDEFALLAPSRDGRALRERFEASRSESIQFLLAASMTSDAPFVSTAGDVRLACVPIVGAGVLAGAVLVATDESSRLEERDVARLGALIADAIADQLSRPAQEHRGHLHQISALYQLLHTAIATGSEAEVVRTFSEALSVWEEIEVLAYREDLDGCYRLTFALPGSDLDAAPSLLEHEPAIGVPRVRRLTAAERAGLGFLGDGDTVLAYLTSDAGRWLIALNALREMADRERSEMYVAALGHALNGCVAVGTSRLMWAVMQQFVDAEPPADAATRAIDELCRALPATGSFVIRGLEGAPILASGDARLSGRAPALANAHTLRAHLVVPPPFNASIELRALPGSFFTPRDLKLFEAAAASFTAWLPAALRRIGAGERRGVVRSFDQIVDRYAREAHAARDDASLILISVGERALSLDTTHSWIKRLRPQLRPTDLAGRLASGELGILLLQTPHSGAQVVARRLWRALAGGSPADQPPVRIGVASQLGDLVSAEALIERARLQSFVEPLHLS